jgi:sugar lactone lactonase YvrE
LLVAFAAAWLSPAAHATTPQPQFWAAQTVVPSSTLNFPYCVAVDSIGNVYISDSQGNEVLKETLSQGVYTESVVASAASGGLNTPYGVAVDSSGNVYIVDSGNDRVLKETFSGGSYIQSLVSTTALSNPSGIAVDASGNLYITDTGNTRLLMETLSGGAYNETVIASSGLPRPVGVAVDSSGNVYVSDITNMAVYEFTYSAGTYNMITVPTSGLNYPFDVAVDANDNLYIADYSNTRIVEETYVSPGTYTESVFPTANLVGPYGVAVDTSGNLYIADTIGQNIKKETLAGGNAGVVAVGSASQPVSMLFSFAGGSGTVTLGGTSVVTQGATGLDFADAGTGNCAAGAYSAGDVCYVNVTMTPLYPGQRLGAVELLVSGSVAAYGYLQGVGTGPQVNFTPGTESVIASTSGPFTLMNPFDVAVDASGNVYIADATRNAVYEGVLSGGSYTSSLVVNALVDPQAIALDGADNVYIAENGNGAGTGVILKMTPAGGVWNQSTVASSLNAPTGVAVDGAGNVYFSSSTDNAIYEVPFSQGGYGSPSSLITGLNQPGKIALDWSGNIYIANTGAGTVLMETPSNGSYTQTTLGTGLQGPYGVAVSANGSVFIADTGNTRIVEEVLSSGSYTQTAITTGVTPNGIGLNQKGNLYVADGATTSVEEFDFSDGPSLSFAATLVGTTSSDSPKAVTVENAGNATLEFEVPATGNNPSIAAGFDLTSGSAGNCPLVASSGSIQPLIAGASCTLPVSFEPLSTGTDSGSLTLLDNNLNALTPSYATQTISLSGQGNPDPTTTAAANATAPYSASAQNVTLSATVTSADGTVDAGTVTFTVMQGATVIGTATTSGTVSSGSASVSYALPAATALGTYTIQAVYNAGGVFLTSSDSTHTLTVQKASQTINFTQPATPQTYVSGLQIDLSATGGASGNPIVFSIDSSSTQGIATISGSTVTVTGIGTLVFDANQAGNADYAAAAQAQVTVVISLASQTITFNPPPTSPVTYSPGLNFSLVATGGASGNPIVFTIDGSSSGTATISGTTVTVTGAGTLVIDANQAGNANYAAATQVQATVQVNKASQTISFTPPVSRVTYAPGLTIPLVATGGASGNAIIFTLDGTSTGTGTISGGMLTVTGAGTLVIDANQAGNTDYTAATQVQVSVVVNKASQTISFTQPASPVAFAAGLTIPLSAMGGGSSSPIIYTLDASTTAPATISGSTVSVTGVGKIVVDANQAGNVNYLAAAQAQVTVIVNKGPQTITFTQPTSPVTYTPGLTIALSAAGGGSGSAIVFTVDGSSTAPATISGTLVSVTGAGILVIDANQAGNANYNAATQAQVSVIVNKATATVVLGNLNQNYSGNPEAVTVTTAPVNLAVTVTYNGSTTAPTTAGSYAVIATINDANYQGTATGTLIIAGLPGTVALGDLSQTYDGSAEAVTTITTPSNLAVTVTYNGIPTAPTTAGSYAVVATISSPNWSGTANGTLVIAQAPTTVSVISNASPTAIGSPVTLTATVLAAAGMPTGTVTFLDGTNSLGTSALSQGVATLTTSNMAAGSQSITVNYSGDTNFLASSSSALPQVIEDFTITASAPTVTAQPGGTAVLTFAITPVNGSTFPSAINLTANGLPAGATYTFSPTSVPAGAGPTTVTLTVDLAQSSAGVSRLTIHPGKKMGTEMGPETNTDMAANHAARPAGNGQAAKLAGWLAPFSLAFILLPFAGRLRRTGKKLGGMLSVLLVLIAGLSAMAAMSGCVASTNYKGEDPQTDTVTVTASAGALSHSAQVSLTIQ